MWFTNIFVSGISFHVYGLCCANRWDSRRESSVVVMVDEQTNPTDLQDDELI